MEKSQLLKGTTHLLVLSLLAKEDLYAYKMAKTIELKSEHTFYLGESTVYTVLKTLEKDGFIESYTKDFGGKTRKYYRITVQGRRRLEYLKEERRIFNFAVDKVLN